jgi:hypothetical protein
MVDVDFSIIFAGLSIAASVVYYASVLRNANIARQRELIYQRFQGLSKEYIKTVFELSNRSDWDTLDEYLEKYGRWKNQEAAVDFTYIGSIYNNLGVLFKEENVDPDFLLKLYPANSIIGMWEQFEPVIQMIRERNRTPNHWRHFELLYREAKKRYPDVKWD